MKYDRSVPLDCIAFAEPLPNENNPSPSKIGPRPNQRPSGWAIVSSVGPRAKVRRRRRAFFRGEQAGSGSVR